MMIELGEHKKILFRWNLQSDLSIVKWVDSKAKPIWVSLQSILMLKSIRNDKFIGVKRAMRVLCVCVSV